MSKHKRLESSITRALTKIFREELKSPDVGFVTVTAVKLTNELSHLRIYYTTLNQETRAQSANALKRSTPFIRSALGRHVPMRKLPQVTFVYDESLDTGNRIEAGLKEVLDEND